MDDREDEILYWGLWLDFQKVVLKNSIYANNVVFPTSESVIDQPTRHGHVIGIYSQAMLKRFRELFVIDGELIVDDSEINRDVSDLLLDNDDD